jgi:hypothetical protein
VPRSDEFDGKVCSRGPPNWGFTVSLDGGYSMRTCLIVALTGLMIAWQPYTWASVDTGSRNIVLLGCLYGSDGSATTCYLTLDGAPFGPATCSGNQVRWDSSTPAGKNALPLFLAAYYGGKQIHLQISDACYALDPNWPTFLWINE